MVKYIALKPLILNEKKIPPGKQVKGMSKRMLDVNIRLGRIEMVDDKEPPKKETEKEVGKEVEHNELELYPEPK